MVHIVELVRNKVHNERQSSCKIQVTVLICYKMKPRGQI